MSIWTRPSPPARRVLGTALALATILAAAGLAQPETVILFDPDLVETPESVRFDRHDNIYITLGLTGEIRKIDRHGVQSMTAAGWGPLSSFTTGS